MPDVLMTDNELDKTTVAGGLPHEHSERNSAVWFEGYHDRAFYDSRNVMWCHYSIPRASSSDVDPPVLFGDFENTLPYLDDLIAG